NNLYDLCTKQSIKLYSLSKSTIPSQIEELVRSQKLVIDFRLISAPSEIGKLMNLRHLSFHNNRLITIPTELCLLKLQEFFLCYNKIKSLPTEIGNLCDLENFALQSNLLQTLPTEIGKLKNLKIITLYFNPLQTLPIELEQLTELQE